MPRPYFALLIPLLLTVSPPLASQDPPTEADSSSVVRAGQEAGMHAGQTAGLAVAILGTTAATIVLTPFIGGVGSFLTGMLVPGKPSRVPLEVPEATHPAYQSAYREAYQQAYRPRLRQAVTASALLGSGVWLLIILGMGG